MALFLNPYLTAAENFLGGLNIVALALLRGETPDEIQETAQFYGYEDWGQGPERRFVGRKPYNPKPGEYASVTTIWTPIWTPQGGVCRILVEHPAGEDADLAAAAARWRQMTEAPFPDRWELTLAPSRPDGATHGRAVTEAWLRKL